MTPSHNAWSILKGGLEALEGRWPEPKLMRISLLVDGKDQELVRRAALEARGIVQAEDRAPNITRLFAVCLERQEGFR